MVSKYNPIFETKWFGKINPPLSLVSTRPKTWTKSSFGQAVEIKQSKRKMLKALHSVYI